MDNIGKIFAEKYLEKFLKKDEKNIAEFFWGCSKKTLILRRRRKENFEIWEKKCGENFGENLKNHGVIFCEISEREIFLRNIILPQNSPGR